MCAWDLKWKGILLKHNHFNDSWRCWNLLVLPVAPVRCILCQFDLPLLFLNSILFCVRACVCVFYSFEILDYYFLFSKGGWAKECTLEQSHVLLLWGVMEGLIASCGLLEQSAERCLYTVGPMATTAFHFLFFFFSIFCMLTHSLSFRPPFVLAGC